MDYIDVEIPLVLGVSGGRSSAKMLDIVLKSDKYKNNPKFAVFDNTGLERPETIQFLKNLQDYYKIKIILLEGVYSDVVGVGVKAKEVDFDTLDMSGEVYYNSIKSKNKGQFSGLPFTDAPYCSDILKRLVTHSFVKENISKKYYSGIGYRLEDMPKRISYAEIKFENKRFFPLIEDFETPVSQIELNHHYEKMPFKLGIHSKFGNCRYCWKKSDKNLIETIQMDLREKENYFIDHQQNLENEFGNTSFRGGRSIMDLVSLAKSGTQLNLFSDFSQPCSC